MDQLRLYRGCDYCINSKIRIRQPTLGEICDYGEQKYFSLVRLLTSTPADRKVDIWDSMHVFWEQVDEYELFVSTVNAIKEEDTSILFSDLDFATFTPSIDPKIGQVALVNRDHVVIDRAIHSLVANYIRAVHRFKKNVDVGYDDGTRIAMIEDEKMERDFMRGKPFRSGLQPLISALTNCSEFKYRWGDVWDLPIGVLMDAMERVSKVKNYNFLMSGIYAGSVDPKKVNKKELKWMGELK